MRDKKSTCVSVMLLMVFIFWMGSTVWADEDDVLKFLKSVEEKLTESNKEKDEIIQYLEFLSKKESRGANANITTGIDQKIADLNLLKQKLESRNVDLNALKLKLTEQKKYLNALKLIFEELERNEKLNLKISAAYSGNEAKGNGAYNTKFFGLKFEAEISKGYYPHEFKFNTSTCIEYKIKDNVKTLYENMTEMEIYYAYHFLPFSKAVAFANRFSNEDLGILYRYEVGAGFDFEYNLIDRSSKDDNITIKGILTYMRDIINEDKNGEMKFHDPEELESDISDLVKDITNSNKKRRGFLTLGIGAYAFSEIEKGEVVTYPVEAEKKAETTISVSIPAEQRFRIAFCPHVTIRPLKPVSINGEFCWKLPLGKPAKLLDNNVYKTDYRTDMKVYVEYELAPIHWAKKISIIGEYNYYFDKFPPVIFTTSSDKTLSKGIEYHFLKANHRNYQLDIKLSITF